MFREKESFDHNYFIDPRVYIAESTIEGAGIGCFTSEDIPSRTIIESSPVILCHADTFHHLNQLHYVRHILSDYPFKWPDDGMSAISLGWGGIYNHSFEPNCHWRFRTKREDGYNALIFRTTRDVKAGEELFTRYIHDSDKLWFVDESIDPLATTRHKTDRQMVQLAESSPGMLLSGDLKSKARKREARLKSTSTLGSLSTLGKKK